MKTGRNLLIVEDDEAIATGLAINLRLAGHQSLTVGDGDAAIAAVSAHDFDLILLDINLPKKNGLEVLSALRGADDLVPVIVLSARDSEYDKVAALRLGADDYVTKPFALAELMARVDAVLRRSAHVAVPPPTMERPLTHFSDVVVDTVSRVVTRGGELVHLTHLEFELLTYFVAHPTQVCSRGQLLKAVWGQSAGTARTVDNFVGQLRKHLERDPESPQHFITVRGSGYRFDP